MCKRLERLEANNYLDTILVLGFIDVNTRIEYLYGLGCKGSQLYFVSC